MVSTIEVLSVRGFLLSCFLEPANTMMSQCQTIEGTPSLQIRTFNLIYIPSCPVEEKEKLKSCQLNLQSRFLASIQELSYVERDKKITYKTKDKPL